MQVPVAHLRDQGIDFAVFDADADTHRDADRDRLLARLVVAATRNGLRIQKAALAFMQHGELTFYGSPDLVRYLVNIGGVPHWTHTLDV
jgi:hypothetical protein